MVFVVVVVVIVVAIVVVVVFAMWVCVVESGCSLQFYSLLASCYAFLLCILLSLLTIHLLVLRCNTSLEVRNSQTKPMKRRIFKRQVLKLVRSLDS